MALTKIKTGSVSDSITLTTPTIDGVLTANGGAVFNEASADVDFRIESDNNTHALFVEGSTGNVGLGLVPTSFANRTSLDIGLGGKIWGHVSATETGHGSNFYFDGAYKRIAAVAPTKHVQDGNGHTLSVAASGAANSTITWIDALNLNSSGNVGVGVVPQTNWAGSVHDGDVIQVGTGGAVYGRGGGNLDMHVSSNLSRDSSGNFKTIATGASQFLQLSGGAYHFNSAASVSAGATATQTTKATIDGSGNIKSQYGSAIGYAQTSGSGGMCYRNDDGSVGGALILTNDADTGWSSMYLNKFDWSSGKDDRMMQFSINGTGVGYIRSTSSGTSFVTSSDYRLKENVVPMTGSIDRVKALKPSRFNFLVDADNTVDGFLAHEAQTVVPECVTGTKDAMRDEEYEVTAAVLDDEGLETTAAVMGTRSVPDMQGIDQSKLVPLLVAALQEAIARIEILEGA